MSDQELISALEAAKENMPKDGSGFEESEDFKFRNKGDRLVGTFERMEMASTRYGDKPVVDVRTDDGLFSFWPTPALKKQLDACTTGSRIAIELVDLIATDKGNPFKKFVVVAIPGANLMQSSHDEEPPF